MKRIRASGSRSSNRGAISTKAITTVGQAKGLSPLVEISVKGDAPRKVEKAADALAQRVIGNVSEYVDDKIASLKAQIAGDEKELVEIKARIERAQTQLEGILGSKSLPLAERLLLLTNINNVLGFAEQRRRGVQDDMRSAQQLLSLAENVERSRIVEPAAAVKTTARSGRNSALVGALIGFLLGAGAALGADAWLAGRTRRPAP